MFPSTTTESPTRRSASDRRSLSDLMRGALGTALEFATLGEATIPQAEDRPAPPAPFSEHPHRRALARPSRPRRDGAIRPRAQVCTAPVPSHQPRAQ
jgi:hypothetical protein